MTPDIIAIVAVGITLAGLMVAIWRDARTHTDQGLAQVRAEVRDLRAEARADSAQMRAENQGLRDEVRADNQNLRQEIRADLAEVKSNVAGLRRDVQSLSERTSRLEGVIEGVFSGRDRRNDAA